jgi:hypothetical protein
VGSAERTIRSELFGKKVCLPNSGDDFDQVLCRSVNVGAKDKIVLVISNKTTGDIALGNDVVIPSGDLLDYKKDLGMRVGLIKGEDGKVYVVITAGSNANGQYLKEYVRTGLAALMRYAQRNDTVSINTAARWRNFCNAVGEFGKGAKNFFRIFK